MGKICCNRCNGCHKGDDKNVGCPKRLNIQGHYYRVLSVAEFAKRRRRAYRLMNQDRDDAWDGLEGVYLYSPYRENRKEPLLPISSAPYIGRMFVERVSRKLIAKAKGE